MKRDEWTFTYTGTKLALAAKKKLETHRAKRTWWEGKKKECMDKVKEGGIEVKDSVAAGYSNTKGLRGPEIYIDESLQRELTECQSKIMEHHKLVQSYEGWLAVLLAHPKAKLALHHDDYLFFFGE